MAADAPKLKRHQPYWKSIFLSATHCGSGCVIGDIIGAPIVPATGWALFGQRLYADYIVEFGIAYLFGIAFQYFPIRAMRHVPPKEAIIDAAKADTLSLIAFEVGMFSWMAVIWFLLMATNRPDASSIVFWFMMQIGMVLGFLTTYPANCLLVRWGVKSTMYGTARGASTARAFHRARPNFRSIGPHRPGLGAPECIKMQRPRRAVARALRAPR